MHTTASLDHGAGQRLCRSRLDLRAQGLQGAAQTNIQLLHSSTNLGFAAGSNFLINQLAATVNLFSLN